MKTFLLTTAAATFCVSSVYAAGHSGPTGYALTDGGGAIVTLPSLDEAGETLALTGGTLDAIATRPVTGELYGITRAGAVFTVDLDSGALIPMDAALAENAMLGDTAAVAFDFNNAIDAVRAVSTDGVNVVYFPAGFGDNDDRANSVLRFTDLAYAEGDINASATPMIFANAYTNAIKGEKASETFQYALDAGTDALVSLANNAGTLATVAPLTLDGAAVDVSAMGGFDILSAAEGENMAVALLTMEGSDTAGLYGVDLATGALSLMADTGLSGVSGFAAQ